MNIILFSRMSTSLRPEFLRQIIGLMSDMGFDWCANEELAHELERLGICSRSQIKSYALTVGPQSQPSTMVCIGGDGTILEGIRRLEGEPVPVIGLNTGRLGFLACAPGDRAEEVFASIRDGRIDVQERSILHIEHDANVTMQWPYAVNEFAIQRHGASMISVEAYVDRQMVATYHGDGVLLSTPTGSTAYSLSVGGPVVAPTCSCLVISPLAPHNLTMRPVVIPDSSQVSFRIKSRQPYAFVSLDNTAYRVREGSVFTVKKSATKIFLAQPQNISFYDTLREKMMWGMDGRDQKTTRE